MSNINIYKDHNIKNPKQLEKYFKGIANHRRIEIILLLKDKPMISLDNITEILSANYKTISGHISRLIYSGLVSRSQAGNNAQYFLSPYGKKIYSYISNFMLE
jgi:predicted transcriptional regulator